MLSVNASPHILHLPCTDLYPLCDLINMMSYGSPFCSIELPDKWASMESRKLASEPFKGHLQSSVLHTTSIL